MGTCAKKVGHAIYSLMAKGAWWWRWVFVVLVELMFIVTVLVKLIAKFVIYNLEEISRCYALR
jgi:uncharacterized protein YpmS